MAYVSKVKISDNIATVLDLNSSTQAITASNSFEGTWTEVTNQSAIQVISKWSQDTILYVYQGQDGSNADITDSWNCLANTGFSISVASVAPYVKLKVTNKSSSSSATGQITSAATAIFNPLPRKLDVDGHLSTGVEHIHGEFGHDLVVSPMGGMKTSDTTRLVGTGFEGTTFDTNFWTKTTQTGTGDATLANGTMTLATGVTSNSSIIVNSVRIARYVAANPNYYRANVRAPAITGANTRKWGAFDANNGYFFTYDGTTLGVVCRKTASDTNTVSSGSFNGDAGPSYALDVNCHTYEIYWTNKNAYFVIDDVLIHTFSGSTASLVDTPSLKVGLQNTNSSGNTNNNSLMVRSSTINRLGQHLTRPIFKYIRGAVTAQVYKYGPGTLQKIIFNNIPNGGTISVYDALTATNPIALISPPNGATPMSLIYDLDFYTGLTVTTVGANTDVTLVYE